MRERAPGVSRRKTQEITTATAETQQRASLDSEGELGQTMLMLKAVDKAAAIPEKFSSGNI